ncbi:hypothetical protein Tcan_04309 [Toxocara canis]|uniref:PDZ domain-containing protein n=1 Tax=Toxocara canis TaxID=6265 RepID=A0A0B2W6G2_TOXCA|nr:hypothetical protein Tcan_04309 [Toxocara canis]
MNALSCEFESRETLVYAYGKSRKAEINRGKHNYKYGAKRRQGWMKKILAMGCERRDVIMLRFGVIVSKSLLVVKIDDDSFLQAKSRLCDFIVKIGEHRITSKAEFYVQIRNMRNSEEEFVLTVQRLRWNEPAEYLPEEYHRMPGYSCINALLVQYPGAALGMNIKSYNSKVYITHTDQLRISMQSCLLGDCIVDVQGTPVTTVASCNALIISRLSVKNMWFVSTELFKYLSLFPIGNVCIRWACVMQLLPRR